MQALQIVAPRTVEVVDVPLPKVTQPDAVLVCIRASSICNQHEWKVFNDRYTGIQRCAYPLPPGAPGHEGAGEVVEVGEAVRDVRPGDRVVLSGHAGDLHQEYVVARQEWVVKTTASLPYPSLAPTEIFASMLALLRRGEHIRGAHCLVIGLGPGGLAALDWLSILGAARITALEKVASRRAQGILSGADNVFDPGDRAVLEALSAAPPDAVVECSGNPEAQARAFELAAHEVLLFGYNDRPLEIDPSEWFHKSLSIKTQAAFDLPIWRETVGYLNHRLIDPGRLISQVLPFNAESYRQAMEMAGTASAYKIVLEHPSQ